MASFDGAYESLVQGVSEQVPTSRLDGQVSEQVNMVSDLVTGVRRRTGSKLRFTIHSEGVTNNLKAWKTDVGGVSTECFLNTTTGELMMLEEGKVIEMTRFQSDYLRAISPKSIRHSGVGDSLFIANTDVVPTAIYDEDVKIPYRSGGFFEVLGSALNQNFSVTVSGGGKTFTGTYTTPNGRAPEHAQYTPMSFIAERLVKSLQGETWIFPEAGRGEITQDEPYMEANDNKMETPTQGTIAWRWANNSLELYGRAGTDTPRYGLELDLKSDMVEGYLQVSYPKVIGYQGRQVTVTRITILKPSPSLEYRLKYKNASNGNTYFWTFKTPSGEIEKHGDWMTSQYIGEALAKSGFGEDTIIPPMRYEPVQNAPEPPPVITQDPDNDFNEYYEIAQIGSRVFVKTKNGEPIVVTSGSGKIYLEASNAGILERVGELPATLPTIADGVVLAVGTTGIDLTYFKFDYGQSRWEETAIPNSPTGIKDMPVEIYWDGDKWVLNEEPFEGRKAGDDDSNPNPEFIGWGITGITSFQGRLGILSGSWVYLSATNKPRDFYRTTVEDLIDTDTIGIGSSSASSASFNYGINFNKDLLLFSPEHQALIAGLNQALTPRNAHILVTSTYTADMSSEPVALGSSVMYPMPRSTSHYGVMEMIPSSYTDAMYSSTDASEHIPKYMLGRCRFMVSSSVSSMVAMGSTVDLKELYIHEYMWSGEEKVLKAWHKWEFEFDIAYAYFSGELINVVTTDPATGTILVANIDPRSGEGSHIESRNYFLDLYRKLPVKDYTVTIPEDYVAALEGAGIKDKLRVAYAEGELNSTPIGFEWKDNTIVLNSSSTASAVIIGIPYESLLVPSPPVFKDYKDRAMLFNRVQLIKMYVASNRTGIFEVVVKDATRRVDQDFSYNPIRWLSNELGLGRLPVGGQEGNIIPVRVDAHNGRIEFRSKDMYEMNLINLEYTCKAGRMRQRR